MCNILSIETATNVCSVVVSTEDEITFRKENTEGPSHASLLGVYAAEALEMIRSGNIRLDAVAVSCGPGSYTGLRIGISEAKGLCYGLGIPLIAIKTPEIMVEKVLKTQSIPPDALLCPMIDARRMEVYAAVYDKELNIVRDIAADIVEPDTYSLYLESSQVYFFGNGAEKCKAVIDNPNAVFIEDIYPSALYMADLASKAYKMKKFVDVAYFEPYYLKDFIATTPKKVL